MAEYTRQEGRANWLVDDSTGDSVMLIADTVRLRLTSASVLTATDFVGTIGATTPAAGTFTALTATSLDLNGAADVDRAGNTATFTNTNDGASSQVAIFEGDRATPADNDAAYISLRLSDSAGNQDEGARLTWQATTVADGATQDTDLVLSAVNNGSLNTMVTLDGSANQVVLGVGSTFAGTTIADLGTVTTADINGGTLDGVIIGGAATAAATVTALTATSLDLNGAADVDVAALAATFTNTNDGASSQIAIFEGDRATPADNDAAYVSFRLSDSAGNQDEGARITWQATTVADGATQDTDLLLAAVNNGSLNTMVTLDGSANQVVLNVGSTFAATTIADLGTVTTANIDGGTLDGVTIGGATPAAATVTTLAGSAAGNVLTLTNSTDGASSQVAILQGDRATPADGDAAYVSLSLSDSAGNQDEGARITWQATTVADGATQDTDLLLAAVNNGSLNTMVTLDGSANQVVLNVGSTFAATTIADLGTVTTADINGGTIDGTTVGAGTPSSIAATTMSTTGLTTTTSGVGAAGAQGTVTSEAGMGGIHHTTATYTYNLVVGGAVSLAGGAAVYTFPAKRVLVLGVSTDATWTSTGAGGCVGDTPDCGIGTGLAAGAVATLDLAGAGAEDITTGVALGALATAPGTDLNQVHAAAYSGTALAASATLYANFADAWAGADTVNLAGTMKIVWMELD